MSHDRSVRDFVDHANRVIPGDHFEIRYVFRVGTCVRYRDEDYVLGIGIGPERDLSAAVQASILRHFELQDFQDLFGLDPWQR